MARSAVNMWIRDRLEVDSEFPKSARQYIRDLENSMKALHPSQRKDAISHAREYAVLYYGERHKHTPVPSSVDARLNKLEQRAEKAERFDRAREFVQKYGPPEKALAAFMRAPERGRSREEVQPIGARYSTSPGRMETLKPPENATKEKPRGHDIPWMMHPGTLETMSPKQRETAQKYYDNWEHKEKHSFPEYVQYTLDRWQGTKIDKQPARQQERSREVELRR